MDILTAFNGLLDNWWQVGLTVLGCSSSTVLAAWLGLNKPFPLSIILAGIQTFMLVEVMPFVYLPGDLMTPAMVIISWVSLVLTDYFLPDMQLGFSLKRQATLDTIWQHFEEVETVDTNGHTQGADTWAEYSH